MFAAKINCLLSFWGRVCGHPLLNCPQPVVPLPLLLLPLARGELLNLTWTCPAGLPLVKLGNSSLCNSNLRGKSYECLFLFVSGAERTSKQQHSIQAAPSVHGVMHALDIHTTGASPRIIALANPGPRKRSRSKQRKLPL